MSIELLVCYYFVVLTHRRLVPETKGRSLEEMDIIFGAVSNDSRVARIKKLEKGMSVHQIERVHPLIKLIR